MPKMRVDWPCFVLVLGLGSVAACGGAQGRGSSSQAYEEYQCPPPIGQIVREDCSKQALKYDGAAFQGSVGIGQIGASGAYRDQAIREADGLVQMLKEQRVSLCNDFNTCKLQVSEYRVERGTIDDSFIALLALRDKMAALDARGAAFLLEEIRKIRMGRIADASPPPAPPAGSEPATTGPSSRATEPAPAGLAGSYEISASANPGSGSSYAGLVSVTAREKAFDVYWDIRGGRPFKGVGVVVGNVLCVGWSTTQAERIGVAAYRRAGSRLLGTWTMSQMAGQLGTEALEGPDGLDGSYRIAEGRFGTSQPYTGTVQIVPNGGTWAVHWAVGSEQTDGVAVRVGDVFAVGYGMSGQKDVGIVAYEMQGRTLAGKWATLNSSGLGSETLAKR
jgi:hypothetical protein